MKLRGRTQLSSRGAECKAAFSHDVHNACLKTNPVPSLASRPWLTHPLPPLPSPYRQ